MTLLNLLPPIRIPVVILNIAIILAPLVITFLGAHLQIKDYILSLSFLRAANLISSCCDIYDFIVVGGGTAGAIIAARLSETNAKVLLIEAGGDPHPLTYIPSSAPILLDHPSVDWRFRTEPQNGSAFGLKNRQVLWPRGKCLGGSSATNFMLYMNGNRRDFDRWAEHTGDPRWSYKNLERYFRRVEDYYGAWDGSGVHGKGGPLRVEPPSYHPGLSHVLQAAKEMGYDIRDPNSEQKQGFSPIDFTIRRGIRHSTYVAYILPALKRPNLTIYRYSLATKIHFNDHMRAIGVTYMRHGVKGYATATKEIIVSGGSIGSPQLLMLSGLGPRRHLQDVGIVPLKDLPGVGSNLQDHVTTAGMFMLNRPESFLLERDLTVNSILSYVKKGIGALSSPGLLMAIGSIATSLQSQTPDWPDIMLYFGSVGTSPILIRELEDGFGINSRLMQDYLRPYFGSDSHLVLVTLGTPKSRGFVRLRSRSPFEKPIIDPRYFSDPKGEDIRRLREGLAFVTAMYENTTTFRKLGGHLPGSIQGCEHYPFKSLEYFECSARVITVTLYHPTSTCSMGRPENIDSVVDSELRVIGVKGLRVADASIMPYVTNANTNSPTIVIGEMAAEMVKESWNLV